MRHVVPTAALLLSLSGCVGLRAFEVELAGTIHAGAGPLQFTAAGFPAVYGRLVDLPRGQEDRRYGVVVVDADPLPPGWRPPHARDGGLLVSAIDRASPLALAGLRSLDRITAVDGEPVAGLDALVEALETRDHVELGVTKPDGATATVAAAAADGVAGATVVHLPLLFGVAGSATGTGLRLGPLGLLFASRSAALTDDERYVDRTEWGLLLDLFLYESETDVDTGETRSRFRLFYLLSFGDDLLEDA